MIPFERPVHLCSYMEQLSQTPIFYKQKAIDENTREEIFVVTLVLSTGYGGVSVQVDFCPWCGEQLTPFTRARSSKLANELAEYGLYRRRFVKQGEARAPLSFMQWQQAMNEFDEIDFLLRHAKPEHTDGLFRRKQTLRDRLALGVVLREPEQQTAEDFAQKVREWSEATPDFSEDGLEGMEPMV